MLSVRPHELSHHYTLSYRPLSYPPSPYSSYYLSYITGFSMGGQDAKQHNGNNSSNSNTINGQSHQSHQTYQTYQTQTDSSSTLMQALEIARESPDGARDPTISSILNTALETLWARVQAQPDSYVMTRDEFAVFNYFQHRFTGNKIATAARKRYWDNMTA